MLFEGAELPTLFFIVWGAIAHRDGLASAFTWHDSDLAAITFSTGETFVDYADPTREWRLTFATRKKLGEFTPVFDFSISENDSIFVGVGLAWQKEFEFAEIPMFVGVQFVPGVWHQGNDTDLGSDIIFRSLAEIGVELGEHTRVSLATDHRSNGNVSIVNPGMEVFSLRFTQQF